MVDINLMNTVSGQLYCLKRQTYFNLIKIFEFELAAIAQYPIQILPNTREAVFLSIFCYAKNNNMLLVGFVYEIYIFATS